jgi:PKD repeat protein
MTARATLCVLLGLLFGAAPAQATLYCVPTSANGCSGTVSPTLQSALDSAEAAGDDVIHIQPGTYTGNFVYSPGIANAGTLFIDERTQGVTLRSNSGTTLALQPDDVDSDLRIDRVRIQAPDGGIGLLTSGRVQNLTIESASGAQGATGLSLAGSSLANNVSVRMDDNGVPVNRGVLVNESVGAWAGDTRIVDSYIESTDGLVTGNGLLLERTRLVTAGRGMDVRCAGSVDIRNVVHTVTAGYGLEVGSSSQCGPEDPAIVDVRHMTMVAEGPFAGPALRSEANQGGVARITARSSIVHGFFSVVERTATNDPGTVAEVKVGHSLADLTLVGSNSGSGGATDLGGNFVADPLFIDGPARDYRQHWPSPTIDAGDPLPTDLGNPSDPVQDISGVPRVLDGNGDGTARRDPGAYEYDGPAPRVSVSPNPAIVGQPVTFDASQTTQIFGPISRVWSWDDGGTAGSPGQDVATVTHAFSTPGTHTGTLTVYDSASNVERQPFSVVVNAVPANQPPPDPEQPSTTSTATAPLGPATPGTVAADTAAPSLTAKLLKKRFKRKKGGTLQLRLSEAAAVSVLVERCTKRRGRRCTRYRRASSKTVKSPQGTSRIALKGLRAGLHRVRVQATDGAGNRSAQRTAAFTVTR